MAKRTARSARSPRRPADRRLAPSTPPPAVRRGPRAAAAGPTPAPPPAEAPPLVIYIHGIGQHPPKAQMKVDWDLALFGSDRGAETRMAYWSDIVHPPAPGGPGAARVRRAAAGTGDFVEEALASTGVAASAKAEAYARAVAASLGVEAAPPRRGPGKKMLPLPRFLRQPIAEAVLKAFIGDSAAYFFDAEKKRAIRQRLRDELPTDGRPITVVAHSQGSVVALEVLSAFGAAANVVKFVTIGSPLGVQEIQDVLDVPPGSKPFHIPAGVQQWHNFADPLDPVALDKGLRGEFIRPEDGTAAPGRVITDDLVVNESLRRMPGFNPHSAVGYLAHPKVRASVAEGAQRDTMARFVVARDVAERLAVQDRQSVLIEVLEPGFRALDEPEDAVAAREAVERRAGRDALTLASRVRRVAGQVETLVAAAATARGDTAATAVEAACIDPLRRFVAARLTPDEVRELAVAHRDLSVYSVWRSAAKKKLLHRSHAVLQADAARVSYGCQGKDVLWAVLDTGVRTDHQHFAGGIVKEVWDCTRKGAPVRLAKDDDRDGHGSHVSGIIAGQSTLADGVVMSGLAPKARLVVYKVLNDRGEGEDAWIVKALDHIAARNEEGASQVIHGINLSLGGPYDATVYGCGFTPICQELRRQWRAGVLVVVACGNEGQTEVQTTDGEVELNTSMSIGDPANLDDCIAVGSVHADKPHLYGISAFSSRGPTSDGRVKPDVVAPGERIRSVNARDPKGYREESGTSMAAPHVSGLLAAFLSVRREFRGRPDEVKRLLLDSCTDLGRDRYHQGRGLPNLMKMLLSV